MILYDGVIPFDNGVQHFDEYSGIWLMYLIYNNTKNEIHKPIHGIDALLHVVLKSSPKIAVYFNNYIDIFTP